MPAPIPTLIPTPTPHLATQIVAGTLARTIANTARRFIYPFAPALSRGLGVPVAAITGVLAAYQFTGVISPLFGPMIDRMGYRFAMLLGLGVMGASLIAVGLFPVYVVLVVALIISAIGRNIFDPALQAYAGQHVPYAYRGRIVGLIELSWSASALIGIPLVGVLMQGYGWQSPFLVLGGLILGAMLVLGGLIPRQTRPAPAKQSMVREVIAGWRALLATPRTAGMLLFALTISGANDLVLVVYGVWMENIFAVGLAALGSTIIVIGVAELAGEGLTVWLSDRIGLERSIVGGMILTAGASVLLPFLAFRLEAALVGIFLLFIIFEFTMVATISLFTEILPEARATMMSGYKAASGTGRMAGALLGVPLYTLGGMMAVGITSGIVTLLGLLCLRWALGKWHSNSPHHATKG